MKSPTHRFRVSIPAEICIDVDVRLQRRTPESDEVERRVFQMAIAKIHREAVDKSFGGIPIGGEDEGAIAIYQQDFIPNDDSSAPKPYVSELLHLG